MTDHATIYASIFKQPLNSGSAAMLRQVVEEHPYFTPARFFLLQQMDKNEPGYAEAAASAALQFNNPAWLQWQLTYGGSNPVLDRHQPMETTTTNEPEIPGTIMMENEAPAGTSPFAEPAKPVEAQEQMLFEPMHLVDYFASQGIRLPDEIQQSDKLGKQMRSFTEWLKTMKKVHGDKLPPVSQQAEQLVQRLAEKSNTENDIITEAMAEVLALQGKKDKAIELYQKLSLLNPSKNAYFAAKIAELEG